MLVSGMSIVCFLWWSVVDIVFHMILWCSRALRGSPLSTWLGMCLPVESGYGSRSQSQLGLSYHFRALNGLFVTFWRSRIEGLQTDTAIFFFFFSFYSSVLQSLSDCLIPFFHSSLNFISLSYLFFIFLTLSLSFSLYSLCLLFLSYLLSSFILCFRVEELNFDRFNSYIFFVCKCIWVFSYRYVCIFINMYVCVCEHKCVFICICIIIL
jgi:hypothetical protein